MFLCHSHNIKYNFSLYVEESQLKSSRWRKDKRWASTWKYNAKY